MPKFKDVLDCIKIIIVSFFIVSIFLDVIAIRKATNLLIEHQESIKQLSIPSSGVSTTTPSDTIVLPLEDNHSPSL